MQCSFSTEKKNKVMEEIYSKSTILMTIKPYRHQFITWDKQICNFNVKNIVLTKLSLTAFEESI